MPITPTQPIIINQTFDLIGVEALNVTWTGCQGSPRGSYILRPYATDEYGVTISIGNQIKGYMPNLLLLAEQRAGAGKPALANAIQSVFTALQEIESEKGTI